MSQKSRTQSVMGQNQITEGVIWKQLLLFFFPILFGTFFQQLYNTADAVIVGRFVGKEALAAVGGPTGTLINLLVGFFVGLSSGATVIISQFYGAKQPERVSRAVHTSIAFSIVGGIVLMVIGVAGAPWALSAMGTPDDILNHAVLYMRIYFLGVIGNLIYNMGAGILRAIGDSKRPLYFLIASCFTNIVLDIVFVVYLHMGVMGAALATIISQLVSAVLVIIVLMKTKESYHLIPRSIRLDLDMLKRIIQIGFPAGLQSVMYSASNVIIQSSVNALGTDTIAAWTAYGKIDSVFWMIINAFGISVTTFVGQNYGAGKKDRVHKGVRVCLAMSFAATFLLSVLLYWGGSYIYLLFTTDAYVKIFRHGISCVDAIGGYRKRNRDLAVSGSDLLHLRLHRDLFRFSARRRRLLDSHDYHLSGRLCTPCRLDLGCSTAPSDDSDRYFQLPADMGHHFDPVLLLF
jgi:putative MATE family efflux protein